MVRPLAWTTGVIGTLMVLLVALGVTWPDVRTPSIASRHSTPDAQEC
jgi:hypothetical protein